MDLLSKGTLAGGDSAPGAFVGAGSFCCRSCGYVLTLSGEDTLSDCPGCGGSDFVRASLFSAEPAASRARRQSRRPATAECCPSPPRSTAMRPLTEAREQIEQPGEYLCFDEGGESRTVRAVARVDADRAQPGRRRALRRSDRLAPPCTDRAPARRRARARRPQPQRRVRQRRAHRRQVAAGRRRDHRRPLPAQLPRRRAASAPTPPAAGIGAPKPANRARRAAGASPAT